MVGWSTYINDLARLNVDEAAKRMHCILTATLVEYMYYMHNNKHGIELYKYLLSEFVFDSIYNMPNRFPKTRAFVNKLCYWHVWTQSSGSSAHLL